MNKTLQQINKLRKIVKALKIGLFSSFILFFLLMILGAIFNLPFGSIYFVLFFLLFGSVIALPIFQSKYTRECNQQLISKMIPSIAPDFTYLFHSIDRYFIINSHLFGHPDRVISKHTLEKKDNDGKKGIYITKLYNESRDSDGDRHSHLLFNGVILTFQSQVFNSTDIQFLNKNLSNNLSRWFRETFANDNSFITSESSTINSLYSIKQNHYDPTIVSSIEQLLLSLHERGYSCLASVSEGTFYLALSTDDDPLSFSTRHPITNEDLKRVKNELRTLTSLLGEVTSTFTTK